MCQIQAPNYSCMKPDGIHIDLTPERCKVTKHCKDGSKDKRCGKRLFVTDKPLGITPGPCPRCQNPTAKYMDLYEYTEYCRSQSSTGNGDPRTTRTTPHEVRGMFDYGLKGQSSSYLHAQESHHMASGSQHAASGQPSPLYQMAGTSTGGMGQQPYQMASSGQYRAPSYPHSGYMAQHSPAEGQYAGQGQAANYSSQQLYGQSPAPEGTSDQEGYPQQYVSLALLENQPNEPFRDPSEEHEVPQAASSSNKKGKKSSHGMQETQKSPRRNDRKGGGGGSGGSRRRTSDKKER